MFVILIEENVYVIMNEEVIILTYVNIDECQQGNNRSKEHSICQDHIDVYYTCQCHQGFTRK